MKKRFIVFALFLYLLSASGCIHPEHQRGDVLASPEEGDIDKVDWTTGSPSQKPATLLCAQRLEIVSFDNNKNRNFQNDRGFLKYNRCLISMNPGQHAIVVKFNFVGNTSNDLPVNFVAESGINYIMRVTSVVGKNDFRPEIVPLPTAQPSVQADRP